MRQDDAPPRSTSASLDHSQTYFRLVLLYEEVRVDLRVGCSLGHHLGHHLGFDLWLTVMKHCNGSFEH